MKKICLRRTLPAFVAALIAITGSTVVEVVSATPAYASTLTVDGGVLETFTWTGCGVSGHATKATPKDPSPKLRQLSCDVDSAT